MPGQPRSLRRLQRCLNRPARVWAARSTDSRARLTPATCVQATGPGSLSALPTPSPLTDLQFLCCQKQQPPGPLQRDPWAVPGRPQRSFCGQSEGATQELSTGRQCPGQRPAPAGSPYGIHPQVPSCQTPVFLPLPQGVKAVWPPNHCSCLACLEHLYSRPFLTVGALCKGRPPVNSAPTETDPTS